MKRFDLGIVITAVAIVAGGAGFALGHFTFKPAATASASAGAGSGNSAAGGFSGRAGGRFGGANGQRPTFGTVTAVSGNTITLAGRSGSPVTVDVTASTTYTSGTNTAATLADVTTGATIAATGATASDGTVTATRVIINPSFGGGGGGQSAGAAQLN